MGFLDKAKENLEKVAKQGQDLAKQGQGKLDEVQSKKKADALLRDLGAWTYAASTGRDSGRGPTEVERITAELQAHEAEHGPLGGDDADQAPAAPPAASTAPPATSPPPAPAGAVAPAPPPAPAGIVPPPPPMEHGSPAGAVPPPPTYAPIPPPADPAPGIGSTLDEL